MSETLLTGSVSPSPVPAPGELLSIFQRRQEEATRQQQVAAEWRDWAGQKRVEYDELRDLTESVWRHTPFHESEVERWAPLLVRAAHWVRSLDLADLLNDEPNDSKELGLVKLAYRHATDEAIALEIARAIANDHDREFINAHFSALGEILRRGFGERVLGEGDSRYPGRVDPWSCQRLAGDSLPWGGRLSDRTGHRASPSDSDQESAQVVVHQAGASPEGVSEEANHAALDAISLPGAAPIVDQRSSEEDSPPEPPRKDGPHDGKSLTVWLEFVWRGALFQFSPGEQRYYRLLVAMWPAYRTRTSVKIKEVNRRLEGLKGDSLGIKSLANYARLLSGILTGRCGFPAQLEVIESPVDEGEGHCVRWVDLPETLASKVA